MRRLFLLPALALSVALLSTARLPAPPLPTGTTTGLTALEKYLFDDVTLVGIANVKTVAASPMHAKLKKEVAAVADHEFFAKYLKSFGVKPLQDVERIVLVMGTQKARERNFNEKRIENEERMYFLFQGKFDPKKFESGFAEIAKEFPTAAKVVGKGETAMLELGNGNATMSLLDRSMFVIAPSKKIVEELQGRVAGKAKAKFKHKDFPAALKTLRTDTALEAYGNGAMQASSKFESVGKDGYKITPITLEDTGFTKLTVRVTVKDELAGKAALVAKTKASVNDLATKLRSGMEESIKREERFAERDPVGKVVFQVMKGIKVKTDGQAVVMEGALTQETAKGLLEGFKKALDEIGQPRGKK